MAQDVGTLDHVRPETRSPTADQAVLAWEPDDPENPYNWSDSKKRLVLLLGSMFVINSTMGSALPSMAVPDMAAEFGVGSPAQRALPISVFRVGYVLGPVVWGPLSEHVGRRRPSIAAFAAFALFTAACALAPCWPALLALRLCCGVFASAPIAIVAGVLADVYGEPGARGRAFAVVMVTTVFGPLLAPAVSGFTAPSVGWRWSFWIALALAGATLVMVAFLPRRSAPSCSGPRAGRPRPPGRRRRRAAAAHARLGARRVGHARVPGPRLHHLLHVLPGLPPRLPAPLRPVARRHRPLLPAHRRRRRLRPRLHGLLNYLTGAYDIFAASANAAASCSRSLLAVVLPLATAPMFAALGISGACALLAGLSAAMCVIPFVFICKGPAIRSRSSFCIALREMGALSHFAMEAAK